MFLRLHSYTKATQIRDKMDMVDIFVKTGAAGALRKHLNSPGNTLSGADRDELCRVFVSLGHHHLAREALANTDIGAPPIEALLCDAAEDRKASCSAAGWLDGAGRVAAVAGRRGWPSPPLRGLGPSTSGSVQPGSVSISMAMEARSCCVDSWPRSRAKACGEGCCCCASCCARC